MISLNPTHWKTHDPRIVYFTSAVYPIKISEVLASNLEVTSAFLSPTSFNSQDEIAIAAVPIGGTIIETYFPVDYTNWPGTTEEIAISAVPLGGNVYETFFPVDYSDWPGSTEEISISAIPLGGNVYETFFPVDYENWTDEPESIAISAVPTSGTIFTP